MSGEDALVIMPTGGGKSLCFQLPAVLREGFTLVISPLIALMKDQVDALNALGIAAGYFNSSQDPSQQDDLFTDLSRKRIKLLYCAPESLGLLSGRLDPAQVHTVAIDEAHCISTWGHDFRPAYTQLGTLKSQFPHASIIALTATADRATRQDIKNQLNIPDAPEFISSFDRPNIFLEVVPGIERMQRIQRFMKKLPSATGIVYALSRKNCEMLAARLVRDGYNARAYHAGLDHDERQEVQEKFINGQIDIVCATIAFGMGIDKGDVRFVIHYNMPKNIEGYYQEIGRAGRDGEPAHAMLMHSYADVTQLRKFAEDSQNADVQLAKLERMKQFADALTCRRRMLLSYFNEYPEEDCGHCDICLNKPVRFDGTLIAQKALSAIIRMQGQAGLNLTIDVLRGARNAAVMESGFASIATYGKGHDVSWRDWQQYILQLIDQGYIEVAYHENNHLKATSLGIKALKEREKILMVQLLTKEQLDARAPKVNKTGASLGNADASIFEELRQLRLQLSKNKGVPPYQIFNDVSLKDMATRIPLDLEEFMDISGVGKLKATDYAGKFLDVIAKHAAKRDGDFQFTLSNRTAKKVAKKKKSNKTATHLATYELYEEGLSVEEIAEKRSLVPTTIIGHLIKCYDAGMPINLNKLVEPDLRRSIMRALDENKFTSIKEVHTHLGEQIDYGAIRIVLAMSGYEFSKVAIDED